MNREDSADRSTTESLRSAPSSPDTSPPPVSTQLLTEDLIAFLDQDLDPALTQRVMHQIRTDPALRTQAIAIQSSWDMLDLLPKESPTIGAAEQAQIVLKTDAARQWRYSILTRTLAFLFSLSLVFSGWFLGRNTPRPSRLALIQAIQPLVFSDILKVVSEPQFLDNLLHDPRASVFEHVRRLNSADLEKSISEKLGQPSDPTAWALLETGHQQFLRLPDDLRENITKMATKIQDLPDQERITAHARLFGLACWYDNLSDKERQNFDRLTGRQRWNKALNSAETWTRQKDAIRKQSFTVTNFNRPEYIMDLATVTASWMKLSPQEKAAIERKSRNQKTDPPRKSDKVNQIAQALENEPAGTFPAIDFLKHNPGQKLPAKSELLKQKRERKRLEYLEVVRKAGPLISDPAQLETFLAQLPPWLVDVIDPLPPDEARRLLSILKILVEQSSTTIDRPKKTG